MEQLLQVGVISSTHGVRKLYYIAFSKICNTFFQKLTVLPLLSANAQSSADKVSQYHFRPLSA